MASLTLRLVKGSPLTYQEVDDNFTNLNNELGTVAGGSRNYLINGNFDIWQRGNNFSATGYTADRWRSELGSGAGSVARTSFTAGQTDVPGEPKFFLRHIRSTAAAAENFVLEQRVEGVRTLAGETVTWTIWAKVSSGTKSLVPRITQNFGSGGSTAVDTSLSAITLTTSWQKFDLEFSVPSISGKTIGTSDYLAVRMVEASGFNTFTADFARTKLEKGSIATDFADRLLQEELSLCQRYYWKTFDQGQAPVQNSGTIRGALRTVGSGNNFTMYTKNPVHMRSIPTVTLYNHAAANNDARNISDNTDTDAIVSLAGESSISIINNGPVSTNDGDYMVIHLAADAEL